ncbi:MAG: YgiT-type zinc finger domain-containing protein [Deltaproteobacteria bacterium RIFOXYD12_FULL_50_9]|nr:MAG: YgiT-type zinc finger domain-containing protein [Deltaproteobacteria bacterium RIFOXYD12_FULL_50_9]
MNCHSCGTQLVSVITDLPFKLGKKRIVILKDLPVLQCENCGEYLLEDMVMAKIEDVLDHVDSSVELEILRYAA